MRLVRYATIFFGNNLFLFLIGYFCLHHQLARMHHVSKKSSVPFDFHYIVFIFFYYSYIIVFIFGFHSIYMQAYMRNNLIWPQPNREKRIPITVYIFEEARKQHDRDSLEEDLPSQIELHYRYYVHICVVCTTYVGTYT